MVIVETRGFTARIVGLLSNEDYRLLQLDLVRAPEAGRVIPGTGGLRKLRWGASGRGKRGGARIIYFWHPKSQSVLMLFAYPKNERSDLTPAQKRALRKVVETEYP
jgi:hypothetical protein